MTKEIISCIWCSSNVTKRMESGCTDRGIVTAELYWCESCKASFCDSDQMNLLLLEYKKLPAVVCSCEDKCQKEYDEQYDAPYCAICREWLERNCSNPQCRFCQNKPPKRQPNED